MDETKALYPAYFTPDEITSWNQADSVYIEADGNAFFGVKNEGNVPKSPLYARGNVRRQVRRWARTWPKDKLLYIVPGWGTGQHVKALFEHINEHAYVVVLERQWSLIKTYPALTGIEDQVSQGRLVIITESDTVHIRSRLAHVVDALCLRACLCSPLATYDTEWWREVCFSIIDLAVNRRTGLNTQSANSEITCLNLLDNLIPYLACRGVRSLLDKFKSKPAIVVSAGPSLDKQLPLLKKTQGRYVLITCLTALKTLLMNNIWPNFVTALDYHSHSGKFLQDIPLCLNRMHCIFEPKVSAAVVQSALHREAKVSLLRHSWLDALLWPVQAQKTPMIGGTTVAHLNFSLAWFMGCDPIIMVGQDLAFPPDDKGNPQYYPESIFEAHPWKEEQRNYADPRKTPLRLIPGYDNKLVATNDQMLSYLGEFEELWNVCKAKIVDATEGGAKKMHVSETIPLTEALETYCKDPLPAAAFDYLAKLPAWNLPPDLHQNALSALQNLLPALENLYDMLLQDEKDTMKIREEKWADLEMVQRTADNLLAHKQCLSASPYTVLVNLLEQFSGVAPIAKEVRIKEIVLDKLELQQAKDRYLDVDIEYLGNLLHAIRHFRPALLAVIEQLRRPCVQAPALQYGADGPWADSETPADLVSIQAASKK